MIRSSFTFAFMISSIAAALLAPSAADATAGSSNWSQNGGAGSAQHAANPTETQISGVTVAQLTLAAGGFTNDCLCGILRPIVSNGVVYSEAHVTGGVAIEAWDEQTGAFLWATPTFTPANNFAVSDGVLVAPDFFGNLIGFSTVDGSQLWTSASGGLSAQPVIANGVVYVTYGHIQALDLQTGAILWTGQPIDDLGASGPSVGVNGTVVYQYAGGSIYAFDSSDGHLLWSTVCTTPAGNTGDRSPMVLRGVVYEGAGCAVNAITGMSVWNIPSGRVSFTNDATAGSRIFTGYEWGTLGHTYDRMAALDRNTGQVLWSHDVPSDFNPNGLGEGPVVANGLVYFTDRTFGQTTIKAFDTHTGRRVWKSQPVSGVYAISIADGRIWAVFDNDDQIRYWALP
jgi:outer membrane protein assembly factor BamB